MPILHKIRLFSDIVVQTASGNVAFLSDPIDPITVFIFSKLIDTFDQHSSHTFTTPIFFDEQILKIATVCGIPSIRMQYNMYKADKLIIHNCPETKNG